MLRPFKTVFIGLLVLIKNKLVDPNKAYIFHQTPLSLGLIVPHGHVWWQEGKGGNKGYQVAPMAFFWRLSQTRLVRHSRIRAFMAFSDWPGLGIQIEVTNDHENAVAFSTNLLLHL